MGFGALLWPRRTFTAFVRGCNSQSLYREAFEPILEEDVARLRDRLGLNQPVPKATTRAIALYTFWVLTGVTWMILAPLAALIALTVHLL